MRARPRRPILGLRGRIVGAVLVTTVATLGVAALALLGPLESRLRGAAKSTLKAELSSPSTTSNFILAQPWLASSSKEVLPASPASKTTSRSETQAEREAKQIQLQATHALHALGAAAKSLEQRIGASDVVLLGYFEPSGDRFRPVIGPTDPEVARSDTYGDVVQAYRAHKPYYSLASIGGTDYARAAIPFTTTLPGSKIKERERWVLVVRKPLDEVSAAVASVRKAFLFAALAGLALTLILAIPLASTLVRRLRRLRQAAVAMADEGPAVEIRVDRSRDEIGDLARTFTTMQDRLRQQEEARRAFVATASHELRTPLASLDGMLELLDDELRAGDPDLDDSLSLLERARAQSKRLGRLAADLLDLSRIDAQVTLRSEPVELSELSRAVLAEFQLGLDERAIVADLDDSVGSVWALGDPGSVARILRILLDNAVRMSPDGGEIRVVLTNGTHASLSVCDQGPGVAPDERELIFERFKRGRDTAGRAGFGLGLAIGRELAERMGGALELEPRDRPGAKFTLQLPAAQAPRTEPLIVA